MKVFSIIIKILVALAAVAGAVYIAATYGDKIVAWAKKLLGSCKCCCGEEECCCCDERNADLSVKTMFVMAVATSIDALAVGISLAMAGDVNIWLAATFIGICTCTLSACGVKIGNVFGTRYEQKAQIAGGAILILLGLKILLEHLGVIA